MKKISIKSLGACVLSLATVLITPIIQAQNSGELDIVTINVVCTGKTEAEAISEGLRSALTQTSVVFISSNTTIVNDQLTKDEISMINNGSINKYVVLDKFVDDKGEYKINLQVSISLAKFESFVKSSGGETELQGGLFAANIKLMELNEKAEINAINNLIKASTEILKSSFDYKIENGDPINDEGYWRIPLNVTISKNKNYNTFTNFFYGTLKNLSMNKNDLVNYLKLNKSVSYLALFDNSKLKNSTPQINFKHKPDLNSLPKDFSLNYFVKYNTNFDQGDPDSFSFKTNSNSKANKFMSNYNDMMSLQNFNYRNLDNSWRIDKRFLTSNDSGYYQNIYLRNSSSFELINDFVASIEGIIKDVDIFNGIDSINLLNTYATYQQSYYNEFKKFRYSNELSNFLITMSRNNSGFYEFYSPVENSSFKFNYHYTSIGGFDYDNYIRWGDVNYITYDRIYSFNKENNTTIEDNVLRNKEWDNKVVAFIYNQKKLNMQYENLSYFKYVSNINYFDYVFGNYSKYVRTDYYFRYNIGINMQSLPLQLTLIGNENNEVFKVGVFNYLTTDEIAKVRKYTIIK